MRGVNLNKTEFIKSAASPEAFIRDSLPSVVFAGRSNVGKSSTLNRLLGRKNLARVGSQPGKTVHVNYFLADGKVYFVDLPGYGYAAVPKAEKDRWGRLMESFFSDPARISLGVLIVDARHRPTEDDITMYKWFREAGCPAVVAANKCDKLNRSEQDKNSALIRGTLELGSDVPLVLFSAQTGFGKDSLLSTIFNAI